MNRHLYTLPCWEDSLHSCLQVGQTRNILPMCCHMPNQSTHSVTIPLTRAIPRKQEGGRPNTPPKLPVQLPLIGEGDYQYLGLCQPAPGTPSPPTLLYTLIIRVKPTL